MREEEQQHQEQLATFLMQFQGEVRKVESLQQSRTQEESVSLQGAVGGMEEPRSIKPPILLPFSGSDPVPKDEASCEQWVWQAKEALKSCTVGAVRIAIVQSVRGEVREFAAAVGFEESVETLLDKVEDRFGEKWTVDGLQQDFYKITQGKNEKVRQFAGRLEAQFKKLKEKVPGRYDNSMLKERLFHSMHQKLKDCYKREETTYEELFWEAVEAEKEKNSEIKVTSLKVKSTIVGEELVKLGNAWEVGTLGSFVSARIAQLENAPMINQIDHYVRLTQKVTLPPMQVHKTVDVAKIPILGKRLNVMTESLLAQEAVEGVKTVSSYKTFKQGGNRVTTGLQNITQEKIILKRGTRVTHVSAANIVPPMLAPDPSTDRSELRYRSRESNSESVPKYKITNSDENVSRSILMLQNRAWVQCYIKIKMTAPPESLPVPVEISQSLKRDTTHLN